MSQPQAQPSWRARLWRWHRALGVLSAVALLLWGLTGLMHPLMSRLQVRPVHPSGPIVDWSTVAHPADPARALAAQGWTEVDSVHAVSVRGRPHWLAHRGADQPGLLLDAATLTSVPQGEAQLAEALARHYSGLTEAPVSALRLLTRFDDDYLPVNRLLPVWRVDLRRPDGTALQAYIDTRQMRLATLIDPTRRRLTQLFAWGHQWTFIPDDWGAGGLPLVRWAAQTLALLALLASALTGLYFFVVLRHSASRRLSSQPLRRWHRRLGAVLAVTTLMFVGSGAFHLGRDAWRQAWPPSQPAQTAPRLSVSAVSTSWAAVAHAWHDRAPGRVGLVPHGGQALWLLHPAGQPMPRAQVGVLAMGGEPHQHHHDHAKAKGPSKASAARLISARSDVRTLSALARALAVTHSGLSADQVVDVVRVDRFGGEYGFLNKRLPVWKVSFRTADHRRVYVEPETGALALTVTDIDATEGWSFSNLHKWHLLDMNKDVRDVWTSVLALLHVGLGVAGLLLVFRSRRRR